jgi:hypothetical protein
VFNFGVGQNYQVSLGQEVQMPPEILNSCLIPYGSVSAYYSINLNFVPYPDMTLHSQTGRHHWEHKVSRVCYIVSNNSFQCHAIPILPADSEQFVKCVATLKFQNYACSLQCLSEKWRVKIEQHIIILQETFIPKSE